MNVLSYSVLKEKKGIPYTRAHLWRLEAAGQFPRRIQLSENRIAWVEQEVDEWLAEKAARRNG